METKTKTKEKTIELVLQLHYKAKVIVDATHYAILLPKNLPMDLKGRLIDVIVA